MSDFNSTHNRAVWFDIPVADLDRATRFYGAVLKMPIHKVESGGFTFSVLDHGEGNGGCLVPGQGMSATGGILVYLNVDKRIRDAVAQVEQGGGKVIEAVQSIGPHGFRAIIVDTEGNRVALHSHVDA